MGKHRILRIASRRDRVVSFREVWASEPVTFTEDQVAALDLGCTIVTDEGRITDLNAYYEASEAERNNRALDLVS
jgi:hypothetical protein